MKILVDADACPNPVKDIIFRAAERRQLETLLVANRFIAAPPSRFIRAIQVEKGFDVADNEIVKRAESGGSGSHRKRSRSPQPARRVLYGGKYPSTTEHTGFYGYYARQRHSIRRSPTPDPTGPSGFRQCPRPLSDPEPALNVAGPGFFLPPAERASCSAIIRPTETLKPITQ